MSKKITCTRCLGKGFIDKKDIKRLSRGLNRVSEWEENSDCKFCKGEGTITEKFASKHNPDSGEFPNVQNYSGLVDFLELTAEEKNERFTEAMEKVGGDINFDKEDELTTNSKSKTIFWTAFISVVLTLSVVLFFSGELNKQGESDFRDFLIGLEILLILISIPATIIYRLIFGKIDSEDLYFFYYIFILAIGAVFFVIIDQSILFFDVIESYVLRMIISLITAIFITKKFLSWVFKKGINTNN
jgi:hypothetical protein